MAEQEPTNWELMRAISRLETILSSVLTIEVFRAHQAGTDRRFAENEAALAEWKAESRGAHVALHAEVEAVEQLVVAQAERSDRLERAERAARSRTTLQFVGIGVGAILSLGGSLVLTLVVGGP